MERWRHDREIERVQAKTHDLEEALEQQKAIADVLKVINRSAFDLDAVFDALLASAVSLVGGTGGTICVRDDDVFRYRAVAEGRAVLDSAGIVYVGTEEQQARRGQQVEIGQVNRPVGTSSTWQSLARRSARTEADYLNGEIVLLGRTLGIPTPVNAAIQAAVDFASRTRAAAGSVSPDELRRRIAAGPA